ncbi:membrane protein [Mycolicibacterium madagascariense]|uniref:Membrane protein n=1 Tax=Mycolicibacterium madagascariense TaxID=212765 RepID=A0A7I7XNY6_9MYCO|nr:DUF4328 domain-containing protein [Mycolicibacterium madagascariense]MCV7012018.1 DUF4328 domain-containing protein [Mycolicibacterium madagascariense]BBZ30905.1 membrane protein [Mycolicibacterium madagascariense]
MIQVCSRCGTRWNVRDRQRVWCPRCQGTLLAPSAEPERQWAARPAGAPAVTQPPAAGVTPPRLPAGYRWIAVRPGAPPPPRRAKQPLGPTPRYFGIPRWSLQDHVVAPPPETQEHAAPRVSTRMVRRTLAVTLVAFAAAAFVDVVNYALLLVNRSRLLNPILAGAATWAGVAVSVVAFFAMIATAIVMTNWLIARRSLAHARHGVTDPRPVWQLWLGCLIPVIDLFWAPVFVIELARLEGRLTWLRTRIAVWWVAWWVSFAVSVFAFATSFTDDAQGIANNTVATTIAYLAALAALLLTLKLYRGFEHVAVDRPAKRWVIVPADSPDGETQSPPRVESERDEPAA